MRGMPKRDVALREAGITRFRTSSGPMDSGVRHASSAAAAAGVKLGVALQLCEAAVRTAGALKRDCVSNVGSRTG